MMRDIIWVRPTMRGLAEQVAAQHGLTIDDLRIDTRAHCISHPRQEAMALMYTTGRFSNQQIASFFGLKDHTSVIHGRKAHAARLAEREGAVAA